MVSNCIGTCGCKSWGIRNLSPSPSSPLGLKSYLWPLKHHFSLEPLPQEPNLNFLPSPWYTEHLIESCMTWLLPIRTLMKLSFSVDGKSAKSHKTLAMLDSRNNLHWSWLGLTRSPEAWEGYTLNNAHLQSSPPLQIFMKVQEPTYLHVKNRRQI